MSTHVTDKALSVLSEGLHLNNCEHLLETFSSKGKYFWLVTCQSFSCAKKGPPLPSILEEPHAVWHVLKTLFTASFCYV